MIATVILDITTKQLNQVFDYNIPSSLKNKVKVGSRVIVPFNNQKRLAYVVELKDKSLYATKAVFYCLDERPILTKRQLEIIKFVQEKSFSPYNLAFKTVIPKALHASYEYEFIINDETKLPIEFKILLKNNKLSINDITEDQLPLFNTLINKKIITKQTIVSATPKIHYDKLLTVKNKQAKLTLKQQQIVNKITKPTLKSELLQAGYSKNIIKRLIDNKVLSYQLVEKYSPVVTKFDLAEQKVKLTAEQLKIVNEINFNTYNKYLVVGPPASGKTEIILSLAEKLLKEGKQALILVPEIGLIPQMSNRVTNRFNFEPTIYHSDLTQRQRFESYRKVIYNEAKIIIGTRSAIFLPFANLKAIFIDEIHDLSYIQKTMPYYDIKEISELIGKRDKLPIIGLTATPTVSMIYQASLGLYQKLKLTKPIKEFQTKIKLLDMTEELKSGNTSILSLELQQEITKRLKNKEQMIFLVNRKGYAPFLLCRSCGHVKKCPNCLVSLIYHKNDNKFKCHHCNYSEEATTICPLCKSDKLKPVGFGIEQVEEILKKTFKNIKILRMDQTTTKKRSEHDKILTAFLNKEADCLLGTQMVSKGHHFENVSLVAVFLVDQMLSLSSYLANEKTYSLLTQHIGRIRKKDGLALIQTYDTDHFVLKSIVNNDFEMYYNNEIKIRKSLSIYPFYNVVKITFKGLEERKTFNVLNSIKRNITAKNSQVYIIGPTEEYIFYTNKRYHYSLTIKTPITYKIESMLKYIDKKYYKEFLVNIDYYPDQI